jgi:hypothetical protein
MIPNGVTRGQLNHRQPHKTAFGRQNFLEDCVADDGIRAFVQYRRAGAGVGGEIDHLGRCS